jgi:Isochorismatase family
MPSVTIEAEPGPIAVDLDATALIIIDMQRDFLEPGGFGETLGNDMSRLMAAVGPCRTVLDAARHRGVLVIHTREGHRPDLSDAPPAKLERGTPSLRIGAPGPKGAKQRTISPNATALGLVMLTDATAANTPPSNVVALDAQLLDDAAAATFICETLGVPTSAIDLHSAIAAGRGPVHRKWGKQRLFRRSDLTAWAVARLSAPIHPRRSG